MLDNMTIVWIVLSVILVIIEAATAGLVVIWFAIGTVAAALVSLVYDNTLLQVGVFIAISAISIALTRPLIKKWKTKTVPTNADRVIGTRGIVIEKVDPIQNKGQVKISGQIWSCKSIDGESINESEIVEIIKIEGVKVIVKKI